MRALAQSIPSVYSCVQYIAGWREELNQPSLSVKRRKELEEKVVEYEGAIQKNKEAIQQYENALRQLNCKCITTWH